MKKTIGLVVNNSRNLMKFLNQNLKIVFGDYVQINNYFLDELNRDYIIDDDVILFMGRERLQSAINNIAKDKTFIVIKRTLKEDKIFDLISIPKNKDVLVVNDDYETTFQTIELFYKLGINDINFIPYIEGNQYKNIEVAVTPAVLEKVPKYIPKVIDLGHRHIDISTFIEIIDVLKIDNKEINKNLLNYAETVVILENGIKDKYKELCLKIEELDTILNLSKDGIIFVTKDDKINVVNKQTLNILDIKEDIVGRNIIEILTGAFKYLLDKEEVIDEIVEFNKKYINVNKKIVYDRTEILGTYYYFQEVTYIKKLEQNLSQKLRKKGQIAKYNFDDIYTKNNNMLNVIKIAKKVSPLNCSILINGESGTGKELIAQAIHNNSKRKHQPFIAVNCSAMPENLLESELFGYEEGSFTGGLKGGKKGLFEMANNGTVFLDEIGDMPLVLQTKILRVLQEKQVTPIGSHNVVDIDIRIIAATHRNLKRMIEEGTFREDLYYRLNVIPIDIPPLRDRKEDIIPIIKFYLDNRICMTDSVKNMLLNYKWKGNVRELQNVALYINAMCDNIVTDSDLPSYMKKEMKYSNVKLNYKDKNIVDILELFYDYREKGIGRNLILNNLNEKGITLTEGQLKKLMLYLNEEGLIISKIGRGGSKITEKGISVYKELRMV